MFLNAYGRKSDRANEQISQRVSDSTNTLAYVASPSLNAEQLDFILIASPKRREIPVKDDTAPIQLDTNLATRDTLVANLD